MNPKKWVLNTILSSLALMIGLMFVSFVVDPLMQYRIASGKYFLNSRFVSAGIIKNYEYDAVVIGSSMVQNFSMQSFRDKLNYNPIKATIGGLSLSEMKIFTETIKSKSEVKKAYICLDLYMFTSKKEDDSVRLPHYLYGNNVINDYRYLLGYETLMRFIPVNLAINTLYMMGGSLPDKYKKKVNIDCMDYWQDEHVFGEDAVIDNYLKGRNINTSPDTDNLYETMVSRVDDLLETLDFSEEYVFFFPPYSALFWYQNQQDNCFDIYQDVKVYIVEKLSEMTDAEIYDFQAMPLIVDLNNYMDTTHYSADINEMMIDCFLSGDYKVDSQTIPDSIDSLRMLIESFRQNNSSWLK